MGKREKEIERESVCAWKKEKDTKREREWKEKGKLRERECVCRRERRK